MASPETVLADYHNGLISNAEAAVQLLRLLPMNVVEVFTSVAEDLLERQRLEAEALYSSTRRTRQRPRATTRPAIPQ